MSIVWTFRLIDRVMHSLVRRLGFESRLGAWVAYWSGRVVFWQLRYVERIERISGWEAVQPKTSTDIWLAYVDARGIPYTLQVNGTVRHGFIGDAS